jgi:hypothetical protein
MSPPFEAIIEPPIRDLGDGFEVRQDADYLWGSL